MFFVKVQDALTLVNHESAMFYKTQFVVKQKSEVLEFEDPTDRSIVEAQ